jgi:hypothetical protein
LSKAHRPSDPITGAIGDGRGQNVEFSGWLGFASVLEELLSDPSPGHDAPLTGEVSLQHP